MSRFAFFRNMNLSAKIFTVLAPVLFLGIAAVVYVNYHYQEQIILEQAQRDAQSGAALIKVALVSQMVQKLRVEDSFLHDISNVGDVHNVDVIFRLDSLHLRDQYVDSIRTDRLKNRENILLRARYEDAELALQTGHPTEVIACRLNEHPDRTLQSLLSWKPFWLHECDQLQIVTPFNAEAKCQSCHDVRIGTPLGAAFMEVSLTGTTAAIHENAGRSILILMFFVVVGGLAILVIFQQFVNKPVRKLVNAATVIGTGNLRSNITADFDNDEFGRLAGSFQHMQESLNAAQQEILHQDRLSTVGQMASGIIHDFRSPMSVITVGLEILKNDGSLTPERRMELYRRVQIALDQMNHMAQELLDYSKGDIRLETKKQDVVEFVGRITDLITDEMKRKGITLAVKCSFTGSVTMDSDRITRAMLNLLNNAEDAMPDGGTIRMDVHAEGRTLLFRITDTGIGVPEAIRETIFEAFVTSGKAKGTGLGLAVTKKIVEQHGGAITFQSELGKGSSFIISLPLSTEG